MDAPSPLRAYLKTKSIHNYDGQLQGPEGKKLIPAFLVTETNLIPSTASLYRPKAKGKDGDPRIWFSKLTSYATANNLLGVIAYQGAIYLVNLSNFKLRMSAEDQSSPLSKLLIEVGATRSLIANELLGKLREVASRGWIQTITRGDTGIGATLESCLGIQINSKRTPDYNGIEIKAKRIRGLRATKNNLFAQVPDWSISRLKSSAAILDSYGYFRGDVKKLYCTVKSIVPNSQGLMLKVDERADLLHEVHQSDGRFEDVVSWKIDALRARLLEKHSETFWVGADAKKIDGFEFFQYKKVLHTRAPFTSNFHTLCQEGIVTLDHLIQRNAAGRVKEKGPIFKIHEAKLELLFPPPHLYELV